MTLVPAKCPECGGNVVVDSEKDAWICDFCKTPFIVDKAIQTFNTTYNTTNVNNVTNNNDIKADVVNVYESKGNDFVIKAGELIEYNGSSMDVVIPEEVVKIRDTVFESSNIHSIIMHDQIKEAGSFSNCSELEKVILPKRLKRMPSFANCSRIEDIIISEGIETIGKKSGFYSEFDSEDYRDAFEGCTSLKSVSIPKSLKHVGEGAFKNCISLKSVSFPELPGVLVIDRDAFFNCEGLETISFSSGVIIDDRAFKNCTNLRNITILDTNTRFSIWGEEAFANCTSLTQIPISSGLEISNENAFIDSPAMNNQAIINQLEKHRIEKEKKLHEEQMREQLEREKEELEKQKERNRVGKIAVSKGRCPYCGKILSLFGKCTSEPSIKRAFVNKLVQCPNGGKKIFDRRKDKLYDYVRVNVEMCKQLK